MKIKTEIQTEAFNDGVLDIYDKKTSAIKLSGIRYQDRVVGVKRFFEAAQHNIQIDMVVRIPQRKNITAYDYVVLNEKKYAIEQVQHINDKNPPVTDLTLKQTERV